MLGRLHMSVSECIESYQSLFEKVFTKRNHRVSITGNIKGRFDSDGLEHAIKQLLSQRGMDPEELLKDSAESRCRTYVTSISSRAAMRRYGLTRRL